MILGKDPETPVDFALFDEIAATQYEWQVAEDGKIWGLVAGDQGYDDTGICLVDLVFRALCRADDAGWDSLRAGTPDWSFHAAIQDALGALIQVCRGVLTSPADLGRGK